MLLDADAGARPATTAGERVLYTRIHPPARGDHYEKRYYWLWSCTPAAPRFESDQYYLDYCCHECYCFCCSLLLLLLQE